MECKGALLDKKYDSIDPRDYGMDYTEMVLATAIHSLVLSYPLSKNPLKAVIKTPISEEEIPIDFVGLAVLTEEAICILTEKGEEELERFADIDEGFIMQMLPVLKKMDVACELQNAGSRFYSILIDCIK